MPCITESSLKCEAESNLGQQSQPDSSTASGSMPGDRDTAPTKVSHFRPGLQDGRQVGKKLGLTFGLLIVILLTTGYVALDRVQRMYARLEQALSGDALAMRWAQDSLRYSSENSRIAMEIFLVQRPEVIEQLLARRAENSRRVSNLILLIEARCDSDQGKRLLESVKETRAAYSDSYQRVVRLLLVEKKRDAATAVMLQETNAALLRYHSAWDNFLRFQFDQIHEVTEQGRQQHARARRIMLALDFLVALLTACIALVTTRKVAQVVNSRIRVQEQVYKLNAELEQRVRQRTQELQTIQDQLRGSLGELQGYTSRVETVNQLVELLQSCLTLEEAYQQASRVLEHFFPEGALLMLNPSRNLLDVAAGWGNAALRQGPFAPASCWALRKGRIHAVEPGNFSLLCGHLDPASPACHICVPMVAQGESLGVLSVSDSARRDGIAEPPKVERLQELATSLAEQISLAFANLMLRETLKYQSVRDPLTNLFNRRHMEEALQRELLRAARGREPLAVLMADIDHFKQFNDTFGHEAGDVVLRDLGSLLASEIRGGDIACRYGGEEFLLILVDTDLRCACERAETLQGQVRNMQVRHRGETLGRIAISIGVAGFPRHGATAGQIVTAADRALYKAKAAGRDRVIVAGEDHEMLKAPAAPPASDAKQEKGV